MKKENKIKLNQIEQLFEEAIKLRDSGNNEEAINKLKQILEINRKSDTLVLGIIGNIYWDTGDWEKASKCYEKAVSISPKSSLSSLGLFHSLINMGNEKEGFDELKRFLSVSESEEHFRLIEEIRDDLLKEGFDELKRFLTISESAEYYRLIEEMQIALLDEEKKDRQ